jgi:hypothetical protein
MTQEVKLLQAAPWGRTRKYSRYFPGGANALHLRGCRIYQIDVRQVRASHHIRLRGRVEPLTIGPSPQSANDRENARGGNLERA